MNLLLINKDGTLVRPKSGNKFVSKPWDQEILLGVKEAFAHYKQHNWKIIVISNQNSIAAGHKTFETVINEMRYCMELLPDIQECYFSPDYDGESCYRVWNDDFIFYNSNSYQVCELDIQKQFRKPSPGMLKLAKHIEAADKVWYVGDREEDEQAAKAANIDFIWADIWRMRFTPGVHEMSVTANQIEFLEGIKYKVGNEK